MEICSNGRNRKVVGYWMSEKKSQKLNWFEFSKVARDHGYELVKLDLTKTLEDQGPFSVIIHKLTDIIAQALRNEKLAVSMLQHVEHYIMSHPEVVILDPIENVRKLLDRYATYRLIHESELLKIDVFTPTFVELTSYDVSINLEALQSAGVKFPFVCKPSVANGTDCHKMAIVFNIDGLKDCTPPCVAHTFVNHNAILYKLFVVGEEYHMVVRPSIKNLTADPGAHTIFFDSHDVSKPDSSCSLNVLDDDDGHNVTRGADPFILSQIVKVLRGELGMSLMGIDVVVENTTGRHAIIDINAYPGYDGYPDFFESLIRCIKACEETHVNTSRSNSFPSEQDDSGFETADSSDEKKRQPQTRSPLLNKTHERHL